MAERFGIWDVHDERFRPLVNPTVALERLWTGGRWCEGPAWFGDQGCLLWSDIPNNRIMRWTPEGVTTFRQPAGFTNGHARDRQGRLVSCEHLHRRVTRTEWDGRVTVIADRFDGRRLNSPNDVVVRSDGTVWFTDPDYGILSDYEGERAEREQAGCHVFRLDPATGDLRAVASDFAKPNGLAFSPDERTLYVADTGRSHDPDGPAHIRAFAVRDDGTLGEGAVLAECTAGLFDGFRVDEGGNLWASAGDGVHVLAPGGALIGKLPVPEGVANVAFGGARLNRLFVCATTSLYAAYVGVRGARLV